MTEAPRLPSSMAQPRPIPRPAPVISATWPSREAVGTLMTMLMDGSRGLATVKFRWSIEISCWFLLWEASRGAVTRKETGYVITPKLLLSLAYKCPLRLQFPPFNARGLRFRVGIRSSDTEHSCLKTRALRLYVRPLFVLPTRARFRLPSGCFNMSCIVSGSSAGVGRGGAIAGSPPG